MRELLLLAIVVLLCCIGLIRPLIGLYGYVWFALMRPDVLAWSSSAFPYSFALAVTTLIGSLAHIGEFGTIFSNPIARWLLVLQVPVGISVLAAQVPALSTDRYEMYVRMVLMALLILVHVKTERDLRRLMLIIACSLGFVGAKFGVYGLLQGGIRYGGGYEGTMMSDNNTLALALTMVVPLCWYARSLVAERWAKWVFLGLVDANIATVVMTHSRGAALALGATFLVMVWWAKRKVGILIVLVLLCAPSLYLMRASYFDRLATIENPEEDASASSRLEYQKSAVAMWRDYPWFGVGFGEANYVRLAPAYLGHEDIHVVHNTYLQMLVDSGVFAFIVYVSLLFGTLIWLGRSAHRAAQETPGLEAYPQARSEERRVGKECR